MHLFRFPREVLHLADEEISNYTRDQAQDLLNQYHDELRKP